MFFYKSKQLTDDYIYTDIYCKLSKCIGQTPCLYEHYLAKYTIICKLKTNDYTGWAKKPDLFER